MKIKKSMRNKELLTLGLILLLFFCDPVCLGIYRHKFQRNNTSQDVHLSFCVCATIIGTIIRIIFIDEVDHSITLFPCKESHLPYRQPGSQPQISLLF